MINIDSFADQLELELKSLLSFPISVEIGGADWVINVNPRNVELPSRCKKLIGVKPQSNATLISIAKAGFSQCGLVETDEFFGTGFSDKGSYMMLRSSTALDPADIAPVVAKWLKSYVKVT